MANKSVDKQQYGDFQTPIELARKVVAVLKRNHHIMPDVVIEPTCGRGTFVQAVLEVFKNTTVLGFDINRNYVQQAISSISNSERVIIKEANFFDVNWEEILSEKTGFILIIGNPPWITNSALSVLSSSNLPEKSNFQKRRGIDAITGASNFDISEWMLLQQVNWLSNRKGAIALLCKYKIARKVIKQIRNSATHQLSGCIYLINAKQYFNASVEACLFVLTTDDNDIDCRVYNNLDATEPSYTIGERDGFIVADISLYSKWRHLREQDPKYIWRSGIKHDCSKVMELEPIAENFRNGLDEIISLEHNYIYPLLKGTDIGNGQCDYFRRVLLVTQQSIGEDTSAIRKIAPKTWQYLINHRDFFNKRQSKIYRNKPDFSVFGIGVYTFKNWKIAISGIHKHLKFHLIRQMDSKTVVFDDTVNFLSFDTESEARFIYSLITSTAASEFFESMIFWDEKRPITTNILRRLSFKQIARELNVLKQYQYWVRTQPSTSVGQLELGIAEEEFHYNV